MNIHEIMGSPRSSFLVSDLDFDSSVTDTEPWCAGFLSSNSDPDNTAKFLSLPSSSPNLEQKMIQPGPARRLLTSLRFLFGLVGFQENTGLLREQHGEAGCKLTRMLLASLVFLFLIVF